MKWKSDWIIIPFVILGLMMGFFLYAVIVAAINGLFTVYMASFSGIFSIITFLAVLLIAIANKRLLPYLVAIPIGGVLTYLIYSMA